MRIIPPPKPTLLEAALVSPIATPIIAIFALGFFPDVLTDNGYYLFALPFVFFFALIFGYLGMFLVCLPITVLLRSVNRLNALSLCAFTTTIATIAWAWLRSDPMQSMFNSIAVGALCSLGVSIVFCYAGGITIRSSRTHFAPPTT